MVLLIEFKSGKTEIVNVDNENLTQDNWREYVLSNYCNVKEAYCNLREKLTMDIHK